MPVGRPSVYRHEGDVGAYRGLVGFVTVLSAVPKVAYNIVIQGVKKYAMQMSRLSGTYC